MEVDYCQICSAVLWKLTKRISDLGISRDQAEDPNRDDVICHYRHKLSASPIISWPGFVGFRWLLLAKFGIPGISWPRVLFSKQNLAAVLDRSSHNHYSKRLLTLVSVRRCDELFLYSQEESVPHRHPWGDRARDSELSARVRVAGDSAVGLLCLRRTAHTYRWKRPLLMSRPCSAPHPACSARLPITRGPRQP